jgi:hypothetical protein
VISPPAPSSPTLARHRRDGFVGSCVCNRSLREEVFPAAIFRKTVEGPRHSRDQRIEH